MIYPNVQSIRDTIFLDCDTGYFINEAVCFKIGSVIFKVAFPFFNPPPKPGKNALCSYLLPPPWISPNPSWLSLYAPKGTLLYIFQNFLCDLLVIDNCCLMLFRIPANFEEQIVQVSRSIFKRGFKLVYNLTTIWCQDDGACK